MELTINQLVKEFAIIAQEHKQINGFFFGDFLSALNQENPANYPLLNVMLSPGSMNEKTVNLSMTITVCDKYIFDSNRSIIEVHSDCLQILRDIDITLRQERFEDLTLDAQHSTEPFVERSQDVVAGWSMNLTANIFDLQNWCDIPFGSYDFENGASSEIEPCPPALVTNSNQSFSELIESGSSYTLEDQTINVFVEEELQETIEVPAMEDFEININWT
jgi:hypothetical protein